MGGAARRGDGAPDDPLTGSASLLAITVLLLVDRQGRWASAARRSAQLLIGASSVLVDLNEDSPTAAAPSCR